MKIYVASSWKNRTHNLIVYELRQAGHEVYDYRDPETAGIEGIMGDGFKWAAISEDWERWTVPQIIGALQAPESIRGFHNDSTAMAWAEACALIMPSGRSAHLEAGWFCGQNKPVHILMEENTGPDLMHKFCTSICPDIDDLLKAFANG